MRVLNLSLTVLVPALSFVTARSMPLRMVSVPTPWCLSTTDLNAQRMLVQLGELVSSPDDSALRVTLGNLPVLPAGDVHMIDDEVLCQRASAALDSAFFETPQQSGVYLASVGPRYFAFPPNYRRGEFGFLVSLDSTFTVGNAMTW